MPGRVLTRPAPLIERAMRCAVFLLLAWALWHTFDRRAENAESEMVRQSALRAALERWTLGRPPSATHVRIASLLSPAERDWLVAMRKSGTAVSWDHLGVGSLPAIAIDMEAVAEPHGGFRVALAAPRDTRAVLVDNLGALISSSNPRGLVSYKVDAPIGNIIAWVNGSEARARQQDVLVLHRLLVLGRVGWETKFVIRAMEEAGWVVDTRLSLAPGKDVTQVASGVDTARIDTVNYAAVLMVDCASVTPTLRETITQYVASGGGLVMASTAAAALAALAPGRSGPLIEGAVDLSPSSPRRGLGVAPITNLRDSVAILERLNNTVTVAARRFSRGRVVQEAYQDTWRWRMAASDSGVAGHREWWASLVSAVAYAGTVDQPWNETADPAPLATMIDHLGQPSVPPRALPRTFVSPIWLFGLALLLLTVEWASRRLRGAR